MGERAPIFDASEWMSLEEAAAECGRTDRTVRRWVHRGWLRGYKFPRRPLLVRRSDVAELIRDGLPLVDPLTPPSVSRETTEAGEACGAGGVPA